MHKLKKIAVMIVLLTICLLFNHVTVSSATVTAANTSYTSQTIKNDLVNIIGTPIELAYELKINKVTNQSSSRAATNSTIYGDGETDTTSDAEAEENKPKKPGFVEEAFSSLLIALGDGFNYLLSSIGLDLDTIVYGRVGGHATTNYFTFELVDKNPYGIAGAFGFAILRSIIFVGMAMAAMTVVLRAAWSSGLGQAREKIKANAANFVLVFLLLYLMPNFIDIMLYLRDVVLHTLSQAFTNNQLIGAGEIGIVATYKVEAEATKQLVPSAMYLSSVLLSLYFAFTYVFTAASMMIAFIFFPLVCLLSFNNNKLVGNWFKIMLSCALIPIIDGILLFVPLFGQAVGAPQFIVFIMCMAIIPSRGIVRNLLGVGGSLGGEIIGLGAMMMASRALGGGAKGIRNVKNSLNDIKSDEKQSEMYGELAASESPNLPGLDATREVPSSGFKPIMNETRRSILEKYADTGNFERSEFQGVLSDQDKSRLYKERAEKATRKLVGSVLGGAAGGSLAFGATAFSGLGGKVAFANMGATAGSIAGTGVASLMNKEIENISPKNNMLNSNSVEISNRPKNDMVNSSPVEMNKQPIKVESDNAADNISAPLNLNTNIPQEVLNQAEQDASLDNLEVQRDIQKYTKSNNVEGNSDLTVEASCRSKRFAKSVSKQMKERNQEISSSDYGKLRNAAQQSIINTGDLNYAINQIEQEIGNIDIGNDSEPNINFDEGIDNSTAAKFTKAQYEDVINKTMNCTVEIKPIIQSHMNDYVDRTGNLPHTQEYDFELSRINANERSKIFGSELKNINSDADVLFEQEQYYNVALKHANLAELYEQNDL